MASYNLQFSFHCVEWFLDQGSCKTKTNQQSSFELKITAEYKH